MLGYLEAINVATARCPVVIRLLAMVGLIVFFAHPASAQQTFVMGPLHGDLGVQAGFQWTDNIRNSTTNKQSDLSLLVGPTFNGGLTLPVHFGSAMGDEMTLNAGVSYSEQIGITSNYVTQSFSSPLGVNLMVPVRFGEWKATVGDTFSYDNVTLDNAVLPNQSQVAQYNNMASINFDRTFGKTELGFGAERKDIISSEPTISETDYQFSVTPALILRENYRLFWTTSYGLTFPEATDVTRQNVQSYNSEIGLSGQVTPYFNGQISIGYGLSHVEEKWLGPGQGVFAGIFNPNVLPSQWIGGPSFSMAGSYTHPLNPNTTYSFSVYDSPGVTALMESSSIQSVLGVTFSIAHRLTQNLTLAPTVSWTEVDSLAGPSTGQINDMITVGMMITRQFSKHLSLSAQYRYANQISNRPGLTFDVTVVTMQATYTF